MRAHGDTVFMDGRFYTVIRVMSNGNMRVRMQAYGARRVAEQTVTVWDVQY